ncbi:MAG: phasin family protein [Gammaproteobacteria bacterium]
MAKQSNPFDFSNLFVNFDPTKFIQDFSANLGDLKIPGLNLDTVLESQRKNLEALTQANRQAFEGMQAIAEKQREILQQAVQEASTIAKDLATAGNPQEVAAKQSEILQKSLEKALETMRELAEMTSKTNQETFETLNQRFKESLAELKNLS